MTGFYFAQEAKKFRLLVFQTPSVFQYYLLQRMSSNTKTDEVPPVRPLQNKRCPVWAWHPDAQVLYAHWLLATANTNPMCCLDFLHTGRGKDFNHLARGLTLGSSCRKNEATVLLKNTVFPYYIPMSWGATTCPNQPLVSVGGLPRPWRVLVGMLCQAHQGGWRKQGAAPGVRWGLIKCLSKRTVSSGLDINVNRANIAYVHS